MSKNNGKINYPALTKDGLGRGRLNGVTYIQQFIAFPV